MSSFDRSSDYRGKETQSGIATDNGSNRSGKGRGGKRMRKVSSNNAMATDAAGTGPGPILKKRGNSSKGKKRGSDTGSTIADSSASVGKIETKGNFKESGCLAEREGMAPRKAGSAMKFSNDRFADLSINASIRRALTETFGYEFMSPVQSETLPPILEGKDCLAKAKTGTGKTLGFLIPTIEKVLTLRMNGEIVGSDTIPVLVLSPTRELAAQISNEADILLTFLPEFKTVTVFGGTNINRDIGRLKGRVDFLVATPGRLLDHMQNHGLRPRLDALEVLIMDEADQLLDMGFRPDIERILNLLSLSKLKRQTLLFSATVPKSVREIAGISLRIGYSYVDTVGEEEEQTHKHVKQEVVIVDNDKQISTIAAALDQQLQSMDDAKVMVFFCTARVTQSMALLFQRMGYPVDQIHSRLSQSARTKISEKFKATSKGVLFSSDVSARGMDYPDVTFVLQVGLVEREQYIHRLGRTARAGKSGGGMIILAPYEEKTMRRALQDMPLKTSSLRPSDDTVSKVANALSRVPGDEELKASSEQAYRAWMGYYNGNLRKCGWDKATLVSEANKMARHYGLVQQPSLLKKTVGMMGLKGVPGLVIE